MSRPAKQDVIACTYFTWILFRRATGIWYADGRGNGCGLRRYSLGETDRAAAITVLKTLDQKMAVTSGKAPAAILSTANPLALEEGISAYMAYVKRPAIMGGVRPATLKRYKAIFDKFLAFAQEHHIDEWAQITRDHIMAYGERLEKDNYAFDTQFIELSTINQAIKFLALEKRLIPAECYRPLGLKKSDEISRYCYTPEQIEAMITLCLTNTELAWLGDIIVALATTGLRIAELSSLKWSDIDLKRNLIVLPDMSRHGTQTQRQNARTTKGRYTRSLPIHGDLLLVLTRLHKNPDGRVFHGPLGGVLKPDLVRIVLVRDVIKPLMPKFPDTSGVPGFASARLHSFRHYFCSASADAGIPEQMLMSWLGHKSSRMIRHYFHLRERSSQDQMTKLNLVGAASALLRQVVPPNPSTPQTDGTKK